MKKTKKILLSMIALFGMAFMTNGVKADELNSQFIENLCVTKVGNQFTVQFDAKQDINVRGAINIDIYDDIDGSQRLYGRTCNNGVCDQQHTKIIEKSSTCSIDEVEGTELTPNEKIAKGETVASYNTIEYSKEDFLKAENLAIQIHIYDTSYHYETITYSLKDNKVISVDQGYDKLGSIIEQLVAKYDNLAGIGFAGEELPKDINIPFEVALSENVFTIKLVCIENWMDKTIDQILAEIDEELNADAKELTGSVDEENSLVDKDALAAIQKDKYQATFEHTVYNEEADQEYVEYAWTFDGSQMTSSDYAVDLQLTVGNSKNKETIESLLEDKEKSIVLEFAHHGELPKGTSVKVYVGNKYKDGDYVTLYYYNEETKALEEAVANIEVKDGYVEFGLEHCSEYVLNISTKPEEIVEPEVPTNSQQATQENKAPNNAQTSSMNVVFYSGLSVISLLGIAYLLVNKKKQA